MSLENEIYNEIQARINSWEAELKQLEGAAARAAELTARVVAAKAMQQDVFPQIVAERAAQAKEDAKFRKAIAEK